MDETIFRVAAGVVLLSAIGISGYFRRKADRLSGGAVPRQADGTGWMIAIKLLGLVLWLTPVAYLVNPRWLAWSKMGLPDAARWTGVVAGLAFLAGIYWLFTSIGAGITPTSATRAHHELRTIGPYRYIRHPLYTFGAAGFVAIGLIADTWLIVVAGLLAFVAMAMRTPREEAQLLEKFGDEYRRYMDRTGRFLPRLTRPTRTAGQG